MSASGRGSKTQVARPLFLQGTTDCPLLITIRAFHLIENFFAKLKQYSMTRQPKTSSGTFYMAASVILLD